MNHDHPVRMASQGAHATLRWITVDSGYMKTCTICDQEFDKSATGRLRILRKQPKGESVAWICPECADDIQIDR